MQKLHPGAQLYLFFGDDWLEGLPRWKNVRELLSNVTVALANRSGRDVSAQINALEAAYGAKFRLLTFRALDASSTERRAGADSLCCEAVNRYIAEKGLYT